MELQITQIKDITDRIRLFGLCAPDRTALPVHTAGAHLDFDLGELGTRSYSLVDFSPIPPSPEIYHIAVQAEPDGDGGSLAMHAMTVGDTLQATCPKNSFALHNDMDSAVLIAGGIGVTPIISFATELAQRDTPFAFHYAVRNRQVGGFVDTLETQFSNDLSLWIDDSNPIDIAQILASASKSAQVYCCGPKGMVEAVRSYAEAAGYAADQIHFELFETAAPQDGDQPFEVQINDGRVFTIPPGKTIIDVLENADVDVMYDCQRGDCGICQTDVLEGEPDHRDVVLSVEERSAGNVMQICVSRAKSARLVLDI